MAKILSVDVERKPGVNAVSENYLERTGAMKWTRKQLGMIYASCEGHCYYCGMPLEPFGTWEPDHMLPRNRGGTDELHNLVAACQACNRRKGNRTVEEYKTYLRDRLAKQLEAVMETLTLFVDPSMPQERMGWYSDTYKLAQEAHTLDIMFSGEAASIPRKDDPAFMEPGTPFLDPDTDEIQ